MSGRTVIGEDSVPRFRAHMKLKFDKSRGQWMILAPERLFLPDDIALDILKRCDGERSVAAIVDDLVRKFTAPRDTILTDVTALVQDFTDKGVLEA